MKDPEFLEVTLIDELLPRQFHLELVALSEETRRAKTIVTVRQCRPLQHKFLLNMLYEIFQGRVGLNGEFPLFRARAHKATRLLQVLHLLNIIGHLSLCVGDVLQAIVAGCQNLDSFIHTLSRDESICASNSGNDILDDSHCEFVVHALNAELVSSFNSVVADPLHVNGRVLVHWLLEVLGPLDDVGVLDAVFGLARDRLNSA